MMRFLNDKKITTLIIVCIIGIALFLRTYSLGSVPSSPDWDEVALGYNAYSILQTGKDEYGKFMPFVLRSFDDYKPAFYLYMIIPFIPLFGLDIIAVRLPSAILGTISVLATYFLVYQFFKSRLMALLTSFLLAISPASIQFSRVAFETNTGAVFNIFGVLFFHLGLKRPIYLSLSAFFLGINLSVYQSDRVFTPLLSLLLIIIFYKTLIQLPKKFIILAVVTGILSILPFITNLTTDSKSLSRLKGVSIFSEPTAIKLSTEKKYLEDKASGNPFYSTFHNSKVAYGREIISAYLSHYDLKWLFLKSDLSRHHAPSMGNLYLWELPFFLIGIYLLIFSKLSLKTKVLIFGWYLLVPVPASVTTGVPHIVRTLNFLPIFQIFTAYGLINAFYFSKKIKPNIVKYLIHFFVLCLIIFNLIFYLNQYFVQQNYFTSVDWQYGYKEAVSYLKKIEGQYDQIFVSNQPLLDQSHMFFLFYLKYPPNLYQAASNKSGGFREIHKFDKYIFEDIKPKKHDDNTRALYIGRQNDLPNNAKILKIINYLNGKPSIIFFEI